MTLELKQAIEIVESLSITDKRELLKTLSASIQETETLECDSDEDPDFGFSSERFRISREQAMTGQTLPLSSLWEDDDLDEAAIEALEDAEDIADAKAGLAEPGSLSLAEFKKELGHRRDIYQ